MTADICTYCREREASYRRRGTAWLCCSRCYEGRAERVRFEMVPIVAGQHDRGFVAFAVVVASLCLWIIGLMLVAVMR